MLYINVCMGVGNGSTLWAYVGLNVIAGTHLLELRCREGVKVNGITAKSASCNV